MTDDSHIVCFGLCCERKLSQLDVEMALHTFGTTAFWRWSPNLLADCQGKRTQQNSRAGEGVEKEDCLRSWKETLR